LDRINLRIVCRSCAAVVLLGMAAAAATAAAPWSKPVDGLACRLIVPPRFVIGEALTVVVEVKNTSTRKRYLVPRLDPLAVEIVGPRGKLARRRYYGAGVMDLDDRSFEPLGPGEVKRFESDDLRRHFDGLDAWQCYPARKAGNVLAGKYTLTGRYYSPPVPQTLVNHEAGAFPQATVPTPELLAGQWARAIPFAGVTFALQPLGKEDLAVHEWGVFTVFNDVKYANANRKEEWGGLPDFFYRQFPKVRLRWAPSAWDKPLVYFYARPKSLHLNVKVTFAEGAPVVWWPAAADPVDDWPGGLLARKPRPFRTLTWEAWLGEAAPIQFRRAKPVWLKVKEFALPAHCWLRRARLPGASLLTVTGSDPNKPRRFPGSQDRSETERFLYYDGLVPTPASVRCEQVTDRSVVLRNRANFDIARLFVVDRRVRGTVGFAVVGGKQPFRAGTVRTVEPRAVGARDWPAAGRRQVRQALLDAGLFEAEADSLLEIWHRRLLEADGVTVFYLLPSREYDRMLPLDILPAPAARPVRVGIALHPHVEIEPALAARIARLIRQLDAPRFKARAAASQALLEMGPMAIALLRAELKKGPSVEVRKRIEAILERVNALDWLKFPATGKK
jgi:hypothetical protein